MPHNEHAAGEVGGLDGTGKVLDGHFGWGRACLLAVTEKEEGMVSQGFQTSFTPKLKLQCKRTDPQPELIHTHNRHAACSERERKHSTLICPVLKVRETKQLIRDQDENGITSARLQYSQDVAIICASR